MLFALNYVLRVTCCVLRVTCYVLCVSSQTELVWHSNEQHPKGQTHQLQHQSLNNKPHTTQHHTTPQQHLLSVQIQKIRKSRRDKCREGQTSDDAHDCDDATDDGFGGNITVADGCEGDHDVPDAVCVSVKAGVLVVVVAVMVMVMVMMMMMADDNNDDDDKN